MEEETRTLVGEELIQAQNFSRKFWANPDNAPSKDTMEKIMRSVKAQEEILN